MVSMLLELGSRYTRLRRPLIQLWRGVWRVQRGTLAHAALVIRDGLGRILVVQHQEASRLPSITLCARSAFSVQVEIFAQRFVQPSQPSLVAVDGCVGAKGVTLLYCVTGDRHLADEEAPQDGLWWIEPDRALKSMDERDRQFLRLSETNRKDLSPTP